MDIRCQVTNSAPSDVSGDVTCNFSQNLNTTKHGVCVHRYAVSEANPREKGLVICCNWRSETDFRCSDGNGKSFASTISDKFVYRMRDIVEGRYVCDVDPPEPGNQTACVWQGPATSTTTSTMILYTSPRNTTVLPQEADVSEGFTVGTIVGIVISILAGCALVVILVLLWRRRRKFHAFLRSAANLDSRDTDTRSSKTAENMPLNGVCPKEFHTKDSMAGNLQRSGSGSVDEASTTKE